MEGVLQASSKMTFFLSSHALLNVLLTQSSWRRALQVTSSTELRKALMQCTSFSLPALVPTANWLGPRKEYHAAVRYLMKATTLLCQEEVECVRNSDGANSAIGLS